MISLRVVREAGLSPPALRPEAPGVECWRDVEGAVVAYAARLGDAYQVDVPCVGRFRFTTATPEVVAHAEPSVRDALVHEHYFRAILPLALQVRGFEVLHASAVETAAGVVAFAAPKESGKSTLAFALSQRGHRLWADDAVVFEPGPESVEALAVPFDLRLRADPAALFGRARIVPVSRRDRSEGEPVELVRSRFAAVVTLERVVGDSAPASASLERLDAGAALTAVLEHAYCFSLDDAARKRQMVDHYLGLVAHLPVYRLRYRSGLEQLAANVARLEAILGDVAARSA